MRNKFSKILSVLMMLVLVLACVVAIPQNTEAAEMTISGTVTDSTNTEYLFLSTSGGTMQIKFDSNTDTSGAKFILPGNAVTTTIYNGSDGYWHVSKITGNSTAGKATIDTSNRSTVKGTIAKGTSEELLYLVIDNGTMQIKIDTDTDLSNCKYLIIGRTVNVVVARGSDAFMHALSISDVTNTYSSTSTSTSVSSKGVTGTIDKGTTTSLLRLATKDGTMEFIMDLATDISGCRVLAPGQSATVYFYRGDDAWNHVSKIVNNSSKVSDTASLDSKSQITLNGTVESNTDESMIYLNTSGGVMQIKLDASTNFTKCPVLLVDKSIQVVAMVGSDGYYHAVTVSATY